MNRPLTPEGERGVRKYRSNFYFFFFVSWGFGEGLGRQLQAKTLPKPNGTSLLLIYIKPGREFVEFGSKL